MPRMLDTNPPVDVRPLAEMIVATVTHELELHRKLREQAKGEHDLVTDLDRAIEQTLRDKLLDLLPGSTFAGEEGNAGAANDADTFRWIVDPIDGTVNFARGYEFYTTVVCLLDRSGPLVAVIYQPAQDTLTVAARGQDCRQWDNASNGISQISGKVLHVENHSWEQSLFSLMLTPKISSVARQCSLELANTLLDETLGVRVLVSQAYEALKLAEGGVSAVISLQSSGGWSRDAARLICESAGGKYTAIVNQSEPDIRGFILVDTSENYAQLINKLSTVGYLVVD